VLVAIHDPDSVRKVLGALGLSAEVPELAHVPRAAGQGFWRRGRRGVIGERVR
jgi:hypothetical protein